MRTETMRPQSPSHRKKTSEVKFICDFGRTAQQILVALESVRAHLQNFTTPTLHFSGLDLSIEKNSLLKRQFAGII
jgi:hypothetical protein